MVATVHTVALIGVEAVPVEVQVSVTSGAVVFNIVGLADKAVSEAKERVRAALAAVGLALPAKRITVNLAPADLPKEGGHFDLAIALGLLAAIGVAPADQAENCVVMGELSLDGRIAPVAGVLPAALKAAEAERILICPAASGAEAAWVEACEVIAAPDLVSLIEHFQGRAVLARPQPLLAEPDEVSRLDLADVRGQETAKRALEIAAAGGHNLLMIGPPGAGKSMLASRIPGLLPPLSPAEALELSMVMSVAGHLREGRVSRDRPYRAPHHSASMAAMVGGGRTAKPGEISLAHHGVLFLDELPEFTRPVLDSLRQPIETGECVVARANAHVRYPARFMLVAACNPCKCGHLGDPALACGRAPRCASDYLSRLSGPLLDRIDLTIEVPPVRPADFSLPPPKEGSAEARARIAAARDIQAQRWAALDESGATRVNADAGGRDFEAGMTLEPKARQLLERAAESLRLTARGWSRVVRVSRTIADLAGETGAIAEPHIAEALSYRGPARGRVA